jgi:hypothetical protein
MFLEKRYKAPLSTYGATAIAAFCGAAYGSWVEHCAEQNGGRFPYPFLTVMDFPARLTLYVVATTLALFTFWGLNRVHR